MKKYLVTHKKSKITFLFVFDKNEVIIEYKSDFVSNSKTADFLKEHFPFESKALDYFKKSMHFNLELVEQDLSFKAFWVAYSNKVGNKVRSEKIWNALTPTDQAKALSYIKRYDNLLLQGNIQKLYPETYLYQKRYDNE
jgi:hypothetical protein